MSNTRFPNLVIGIGALSAMLAVCAGAFGAHALKEILTPVLLNTYHTAVDYQFMHSLGLIIIGILYKQSPQPFLKKVTLLMMTGIILFSGSLFTLSLTGIKWLGMITPFGGLCFIIAWLILAWCYLRGNEE